VRAKYGRHQLRTVVCRWQGHDSLLN
jgi:hypothetical protein